MASLFLTSLSSEQRDELLRKLHETQEATCGGGKDDPMNLALTHASCNRSDFGLDDDANPRDLEIQQITQLMNVIAEEVYVDKFDPLIGTARIENRVPKGEVIIPEDHLRAFRMGKEEILYSWLRFVRQIVTQHFHALGKPVDPEKLFQYRFSNILWDQIRAYVRNLAGLPVWVNTQLSLTVFGGKQNYEYWQTVSANLAQS